MKKRHCDERKLTNRSPDDSDRSSMIGRADAFGVNMDTLMRMQSSYDIVQTRKREKQISVPRISTR